MLLNYSILWDLSSMFVSALFWSSLSLFYWSLLSTLSSEFSILSYPNYLLSFYNSWDLVSARLLAAVLTLSNSSILLCSSLILWSFWSIAFDSSEIWPDTLSNSTSFLMESLYWLVLAIYSWAYFILSSYMVSPFMSIIRYKSACLWVISISFWLVKALTVGVWKFWLLFG